MQSHILQVLVNTLPFWYSRIEDGKATGFSFRVTHSQILWYFTGSDPKQV